MDVKLAKTAEAMFIVLGNEFFVGEGRRFTIRPTPAGVFLKSEPFTDKARCIEIKGDIDKDNIFTISLTAYKDDFESFHRVLKLLHHSRFLLLMIILLQLLVTKLMMDIIAHINI